MLMVYFKRSSSVSHISGFLLVPITNSKLYSNKKETSNFHGTVPFDPVKMLQQIKTKMFIKRPTHTKKR